MDINKILFEICRNIRNNQSIDNYIIDLIKISQPNSLLKTLYYLIWATPVFSQQILFIDTIIRLISSNTHRDLADYIITKFSNIESDRRDKFFYFLSKSWNLYAFHELLAINNYDVLDEVSKYINLLPPADWDDILFLNFLCKCKPWIASRFTNIRISKTKVKEYLKKIEIHKENREALFRLVDDTCF